MFRTNNAAVFEGEYLAYYPYTKAFTKGQILANLPQTFTVDVQKDKYAAALTLYSALAILDIMQEEVALLVLMLRH